MLSHTFVLEFLYDITIFYVIIDILICLGAATTHAAHLLQLPGLHGIGSLKHGTKR